ncbi:hypothetical protein [Yersinia wautersii]|uniref:Uncharacterized protein n=1 Tax=Yersinia wautersii TaxID=1341643 RepID=A0ABM9TDY2_9GAMM|nr:hypothetical protein [Yersinia wautersii]CRG49949.1 Uncharacterised protein [Yersinia wautersii]
MIQKSRKRIRNADYWCVGSLALNCVLPAARWWTNANAFSVVTSLSISHIQWHISPENAICGCQQSTLELLSTILNTRNLFQLIVIESLSWHPDM